MWSTWPWVTADELDDLVTTGVTAGQADGGHDRLGTGTDQAYLIDGFDGFDNHLGQFYFHGRGHAKAGALGHGLLHFAEHFLTGMAQDHRTPGTGNSRYSVGLRCRRGIGSWPCQ